MAIHGVTARPIIRNCKIHDGKSVGVLVYENGQGTIEDCDLTGNTEGPWDIHPGCQVTRRNNKER